MKNKNDFFADEENEESGEDDVIEVIDVKNNEERWALPSYSCPECGLSMRLKNINKEKGSGKAFFCNVCGRQSYDEYGRR